MTDEVRRVPLSMDRFERIGERSKKDGVSILAVLNAAIDAYLAEPCEHVWASTGQPFPDELRREGAAFLCGKCREWIPMVGPQDRSQEHNDGPAEPGPEGTVALE